MIGRKLLQNVIYLFSSNVLVRLINALVTIAVAKYLGSQDYGYLSVAIAFSMLASFFTDLGLNNTVIREGTKPKIDLSILMSTFIKVRLILALLITIISILIIETFYINYRLQLILYWIVLPTIWGFAIQSVGSIYFQIIQKMKYTAFINSIASLLTALTLFMGIYFHWKVEFIARIYGFSSVIAGLLSILLMIRFIPLKSGWNFKIFNGLTSFAIAGIVMMIIPHLGPIILERVTNIEQVGFYAAAFRIPSVLYQVPGIIALAFYPLMFELANANKEEEHTQLIGACLKFMSGLGILIALPFFLYPQWWIVTLFGEGWIEAANTLKLLSLMVIIQAINYPLADALSTIGKQFYRTIILVLSLPIGITLFYLLGNIYGSYGGGIAVIIHELLLFVGLLLITGKKRRIYLKGVIFNFSSMILTYCFSTFVLNNIHPIIGILISWVMFIFIIFILDNQLITQFKKYVNNKNINV
jgi:O-antigen/teichoic acid export membrane protein